MILIQELNTKDEKNILIKKLKMLIKKVYVHYIYMRLDTCKYAKINKFTYYRIIVKCYIIFSFLKHAPSENHP